MFQHLFRSAFNFLTLRHHDANHDHSIQIDKAVGTTAMTSQINELAFLRPRKALNKAFLKAV